MLKAEDALVFSSIVEDALHSRITKLGVDHRVEYVVYSRFCCSVSGFNALRISKNIEGTVRKGH